MPRIQKPDDGGARAALSLRWLPLIAVALLLLAPALARAGGSQDEEEADKYGGKWVADLGLVRDLNDGDPVLVKAVFRDTDDNIMDIEKVYVRWEWVNKKTGRWIVLSAIDTYLKCLVEYDADRQRFVDPCYGSEYDLMGKCKKKPAKDDLPNYSEFAVQEDTELKLTREPEEED
jgi:Rieske Fe-S protein